jgi:hypothetical protein
MASAQRFATASRIVWSESASRSGHRGRRAQLGRSLADYAAVIGGGVP